MSTLPRVQVKTPGGKVSVVARTLPRGKSGRARGAHVVVATKRPAERNNNVAGVKTLNYSG